MEFYDFSTNPVALDAIQNATNEGADTDGKLQAVIDALGGGGGPGGESTGGEGAQRLQAWAPCSCYWFPAWWVYWNPRCAAHGW